MRTPKATVQTGLGVVGAPGGRYTLGESDGRSGDAIRAPGRSPLSLDALLLLGFTGSSQSGSAGLRVDEHLAMLVPVFADFGRAHGSSWPTGNRGQHRLLRRCPASPPTEKGRLERLQRHSGAPSDRSEISTMLRRVARSVPDSGKQFFMSRQKRLTYDGGK